MKRGEMRVVFRSLLPVACGAALLVSAGAGKAAISDGELQVLGARCAPQIARETLTALVKRESKANPLAIGVNGAARLERQPRTKAEAVATARWLLAHGYNFDGGLGQVNVKNLGWLGMSVEDLFDPCANLRGAAFVLADCYARARGSRGDGQSALHAALSCYNTGSFSRGLRNGYVRDVALQAAAATSAPVRRGISQKPPPRTLAPTAGRPRGGDAFERSPRDVFAQRTVATWAEGGAGASE